MGRLFVDDDGVRVRDVTALLTLSPTCLSNIVLFVPLSNIVLFVPLAAERARSAYTLLGLGR